MAETEILTRHVQEETKKTLMMLAGALGVTLNELCVWIFEEIAMPHDELKRELLDRAEATASVDRKELLMSIVDRSIDKQARMTIRAYNRTVPRPSATTQPFQDRRRK